MPKTQIPIDGGFYVSDSLPISVQRCVNAYVNVPQTGTITTASLFGTPGLDLLTKVSNLEANRGAHNMAGTPYYVTGTVLYRLDRTVDASGSTYTEVNVGTVAGSGPVSMADNGSQLAIVVPGVIAYTYIEGTGLVEITDAAFDGPVDSVEYAEGYFIFVTTDGKKFINSPLNDGRGSPAGSAYDALDFQVAEADPDNIVGQVYYNGSLYMLGTQTTQGFKNIGRVPAPFAPIKGSVFNTGLAAKYSIVKAHNTFAFIGSGENESPSVWRFTGNGFQRISTTAIDNVLSRLTDTELEAVTSWYYARAGAYFIGFRLPDTTFVYDMVSQKWHERLSTVENQQVTSRAINHIEAYGEILVGDAINGTIGQINPDTYDEYDDFLIRSFTPRFIDNVGETFSLTQLEVVMETGVGNSDVTDPKLSIEWSKDGGRTWGDLTARSFGKVGEYWMRVIWRRLGMADRSWVPRFTFAEAAKFSVVKIEVEVA